MNPLLPRRERQSEAQRFHRETFKAHGRACYFCGKEASDAMHIIPRPMLGSKRYECAADNSRPGCRACHRKQTDGTLAFALSDRQRAVRALNKVLKVKLPEPA